MHKYQVSYKVVCTFKYVNDDNSNSLV